jgi:hypothetical protein
MAQNIGLLVHEIKRDVHLIPVHAHNAFQEALGRSKNLLWSWKIVHNDLCDFGGIDAH